MTSGLLPLTILTGAFGSGKTTQVNRLLASPGHADTAVIIGESGAVAVAHDRVASAQGRARPLARGACLCCAPPSDLVAALRRLFLDRVRGTIGDFARVVVETAGAADPAGLRDQILADRLVAARYRVAAIVAAVDGPTGLATLDAEPAARAQIAAADRILITRAEGVPPAILEALDTRLAALNPRAPRHSVPADRFDPALLLEDRTGR